MHIAYIWVNINNDVAVKVDYESHMAGSRMPKAYEKLKHLVPIVLA